MRGRRERVGNFSTLEVKVRHLNCKNEEGKMESAAGYFLIDWSGVSALEVTPARLSTEMISVLFCS